MVAQSASKPGDFSAFEKALQDSRSPLVVRGGKLSGAGADVLITALAPARFVLLGETHITQQIPEVASALCDLIHPDAYAVEAGPTAARTVDRLLHRPDRIARMAEYNHTYPNGMAFLDVREENDLAAHCAASSRNPDFHLWGLDQEFLGAGAPLLAEMAASNPGPIALAAIQQAQAHARLADALALQSGDVQAAYLLSANNSEIAALESAVASDGRAGTRNALHEFVASREIYKRTDHTQNDLRVQLMKQHFLAQYGPLKSKNPNARVLFKFGDVHMQKGFNVLHERDLGNMAAESADAEATQSLHLFIYGARGVQAVFGGFGKPMLHQPFVMDGDPSDKWLTPALKDMLPQQSSAEGVVYTLYDLRTLRFRKFDMPDKWKQIVYASDLFILAPETIPADFIH
ncbi:MAG: hypothetical protein ACRYHB_05985 [Janthinobacterium lividum]